MTRVRRDTTGLKWILNAARLCALDPAALTAPPRCAVFDPWRGNYTECRWGSDDYRVPWEATGVDDTKLFAWPGRGLWALTGRRPPRPRGGGKGWCPQPVVWQQFLVQLAREGEDVDLGAWAYAPRGLLPGVRWAEPGVATEGGGGKTAAAAGKKRKGTPVPK
jgi:hypothetical protein